MNINASLIWVMFVHFICIIGLGSNAVAQNADPCDTPNKLPSYFFEVPKGPQGTWTAYVAPDLDKGMTLRSQSWLQVRGRFKAPPIGEA